MSHKLRWTAIAGLCAIGASMPVAAQNPEGYVTHQTVNDCQAIPDDAARLACFDRVIGSGQPQPPLLPAESQPGASYTPSSAAGSGGAGGGPGMGQSAGGGAPSGVQPRTADQLRDEFGLPDHEVREARSEDRIDELEVEVASASIVGPNRLRIVTTDGAVWDQTEGTAPKPPDPGATVKITRNLMGGYRCKIRTAAVLRCERVK